MRLLLLDVMGTLVHDPFYEEIPAFFDSSLERLLADKHPSAWIEFERGEIDEATFLERFFRDGRDYDRQGLVQCVRSSYRWLAGMRELLAELHGAGARMVAFSNYSTWYRMIDERLCLSRYLSWELVSCHTGLRKPDPRAYANALGTLGVAASECTFVDDREVNCAAARQQGMRAIRFRGASALREQLR